MYRFKLTLAVVTVAVVNIASAQAATLTLSIQYIGTYDSAGNPTARSLYAQNSPHQGYPWPFVFLTDIHQFDVFMSINGLNAGEDFQTVVFDALLGPGVTPNTFFGSAWVGDNPLYDPGANTTNGCVGGCLPLFTTNQDAGTANDLKAITIVANSTNSHEGTHTRHPGEFEVSSDPTDPDNVNLGPPMLLGSIYVKWNGTYDFSSPHKSWVGLGDPADVSNVWTAVAANNTQITFQADALNQEYRSEWAVIPEPTTAALLALAAFACGCLRRRRS